MNIEPTYSPLGYILSAIGSLLFAALAFALPLINVTPGYTTSYTYTIGNASIPLPVIGLGFLVIAVLCIVFAVLNANAERRMRTQSQPQPLGQMTAVLQQTLHFTDADLQANRAGQLTDQQRELNTRKGLFAKKNLEIKSIEGKVTLYARKSRSRYSGSSVSYWMKVNGVKLTLQDFQFKAFWSGAPYRIYYIPRIDGPMPAILSAEVITQ